MRFKLKLLGKYTTLTVKFVLNFMDKKRIDYSKVKTKTNMTVQVVKALCTIITPF